MGEHLEHVAVVAAVVDFGSIRDDLVELAALHHTVDGLLRYLRAQVDRKSHVHVDGGDKVAELLGAVELVLLER